MKTLATALFALLVSASWMGAAEVATAATPGYAGGTKAFTIFDNMPPQANPGAAAAGMAPCDIIPIPWKVKNSLPDEDAFKAKVRELISQPKFAQRRPGLLVLDIEYVPLSGGNRTEVDAHFQMFINLAKWVHEAAPGYLVGYYGHGLFPEQPGKAYAAETREFIAAVDAFLPSMYNFDDNRQAWKRKLDGLVQQAHRIAPGKPVYPYMWPGYHIGTSKALHLLTGDYWKFQLETARECGADGIIIWGNGKAHWDDRSTWREETQEFMAGKPTVKS